MGLRRVQVSQHVSMHLHMHLRSGNRLRHNAVSVIKNTPHMVVVEVFPQVVWSRQAPCIAYAKPPLYRAGVVAYPGKGSAEAPNIFTVSRTADPRAALGNASC